MPTLKPSRGAIAPTAAGTGARTTPPLFHASTVHVVTWRLLDYDGCALTYGGLQRWLLALCDLLHEHGHEVVVHQRAKRPFHKPLRGGLMVVGHRASARATGTPRFNLAVHRAIPAGAPVVYMNDDLAWPRCRQDSLVIQHGIWWDGESGWLKARLAERLARNAIRRAGGVIAVDTNLINWYRARWPDAGHDHKLHYVPNFIDTGQFGARDPLPAADVAPGVPLTICFPRRSEPRRGIWLMAELAPKIAARHRHVRFRFVVGSGYHTDALRKRLAGSGMPLGQWSLEELPFERMREAYADSAIAVVPTLCGEGTSLSAIEAMHFGCAVVATWVGGLPNLIQDGHNGLLVAPTATAVETALERLVVDDALRVQLGTNARASVDATYDIRRWRQRVAPVLQQVLGIAGR